MTEFKPKLHNILTSHNELFNVEEVSLDCSAAVYKGVQTRHQPSSWMSIVNQKCGPMPNVMVALPNIGGALCSTPQSLA